MYCLHCGYPVTRVVRTEPRDDGEETGVWRRRECRQCKKRFETLEVIKIGTELVLGDDGLD